MKYRNSFIHLFIVVAGLFFSQLTNGQSVSYEDVGVIINMNDTVSRAIGNYFKLKRNIPDENIIPVYTSAQEQINDSLFTDLALQVETYINNNNLASKLNYLVTTKGCPLKVLRAVNDTDNCNSSVESELMMLTAGNEFHIGECIVSDSIDPGKYFHNPYYNQTASFNSSTFNIYLVTRLDAYTKDKVFELIDNSAPNTYVNKDSVLFVFDRSPHWMSNPLDIYMSAVGLTLKNRGWKVLVNLDSIYLTGNKNVIGYMSWGSNDGFSQHYTQHAIPHNTWSKGSIAETGVSTSGRSFQPGTSYGQSLIADLLNEGASAAKGYVYEPYTIALAVPNILFNRYTDFDASGNPKYNLAESYFSASMMIGWMDVVIGDPKSSITSNTLYNKIEEVSGDAIQIFPNPAGDVFYLTGKIKNMGTVIVSIFDLLGREVLRKSFLANPDFICTINAAELSVGVYALKLQSGREILSSKLSVIKP